MKLLYALLLSLPLLFIAIGATGQEAETTDSTVIVFGDTNYLLTLHLLDPDSRNEDKSNATLTLKQVVKDGVKILFVDSLYCMRPWLTFRDFNNDGTDDVLVFHTSSARSNWSHHLYLVDKKARQLTLVKGFTELLNPEVNTKTGVITSSALYGDKVSYTFYRIKPNGVLVKAGRGYEKKID